MKKILYIIGVLLLFASCTKDELTPNEQGTTQKSFNLTIEEPKYAPQSRGASSIERYLLEMYEDNVNATPVKQSSTDGVFKVDMKKGVNYICLFWADNGKNYDVKSLQAVKQTDETAPGTAAYFANVTVNSNSFNGAITLKRAVAELSFINKKVLIEESNTLKITYPYASATFNLGNGTVTHAAGTARRTINNITPPEQVTDAFAIDYILAPTTEDKLTGLKLQLNSDEEKTIAEAAIKANVKTKITGEYEMPWPSMSFTINTSKNTASDATFILPFSATISGYSLTVDWGDGKTQTFASGTTFGKTNTPHTYTDAGVYTITIASSQKDPMKVQMPQFNFVSNSVGANSNASKLISLDTPLLNIGTNLSYCFYGCTGLTGAIPAGLFANNKSAINFSSCFTGCTGLTGAIPAGLFANNADAETFSSCFYNCTGLTGEIPAGLFASNTKVTNFMSCFYGCTGLTSICEGLFANNKSARDFSYCFQACTGLTGEIPAWLFANNVDATNFTNCFYGCTGLTSIPAGLFANNKSATTFTNCFCNCTGLTGEIPAGLFANNVYATTFSYCFYGCTGLSSICEGLFANNRSAVDFTYCFSSCKKLASIPAGLFANNPDATTFTNCFASCTSLTSIPAGLFANNPEAKIFTGCFTSCTGLTSIPAELFASNTKVTNFISCFSGTGLTSIPAGLFANNTKVTSFMSCFSGTGLTSIPAELFANNVDAEIFSFCFRNCTRLTSIPAGLFANNLNATNFTNCFFSCTKLKLNPNIFCLETTETMASRFAGKAMNFSSCFFYCGNDSSISEGAGGTAPALWNYTMSSSTNAECFKNVTKVTNASVIPSTWK